MNKEALKRYRVIDRLLSDPNHDYTTQQIRQYVRRQTGSNVGIRMIQKDIRALEDEFGKEMARNKGRRGSVRYEDQSTPLFYQELTSDEEELLREVLRTLGQFEGLDNFTWFDLLGKKLNMKDDVRSCPIISFGEMTSCSFPAISSESYLRQSHGGRPFA